jgi:anti-sigma factor RsiW
MNEEMRIRRYLLGELSETARKRFESRYFTDPECFARLNAVENDLIDSYVHGLLPFSEQRNFRMQYLDSPARRERVEFARALAEKVAQAEDLPDPFRQATLDSHSFSFLDWLRSQRLLALASSAGVMVAAIFWLVVNTAILRRELAVQRAFSDELRADLKAFKQPSQASQDQSQNALGRQPDAGNNSPIVPLFALTVFPAGGSRGAGTSQKQSVLVLPPNGQSVELKLVLDDAARGAFRYEALVKSLDHIAPTRRWSGLNPISVPEGAAIVLRIPSSSIPPGAFIISLLTDGVHQSKQEVATYAFETKAP